MPEKAITTLTCTQCGGELHPDENQVFLTCPYCAATVYIDKTQVVFHWYVKPTLSETEATASLYRWMSGNQTVKDLDKKSKIASKEFFYFPLWYFKLRQNEKRENEVLKPAAATSITEIASLVIPAGDLEKYDEQLDAQAKDPTVPLETARGWLNEDHAYQEISETALVHVPLFVIKYVFQKRVYTSLVEAGTGKVFANIYPPKSEAPYRLAAGITALVYLCLASIFAISLFSGFSGVAIPVVIIIGLLAAPFLYALAAWVASRI